LSNRKPEVGFNKETIGTGTDEMANLLQNPAIICFGAV
jgi:hypothetical protein